jgi:hypothetical protein
MAPTAAVPGLTRDPEMGAHARPAFKRQAGYSFQPRWCETVEPEVLKWCLWQAVPLASIPVQLMSARAGVQITTATSINQECRLETGPRAPYSEIAAPFAHGALTLRPRRQPGPLGPPSQTARRDKAIATSVPFLTSQVERSMLAASKW